MSLVRRIVLLWIGLAGVAVQARAAEATLMADAHVNSALPGVNSGAISNLNVGGGYTALLQFDLSTLPAGVTAAQVTRATLRLYCNRVDAAGVVNVQPVGAAWGEYSVTYAALPALGTVVTGVPVNQAGAYVAVDVTSLVQGWVAAPTSNHGVALTSGAAAVQFDSKENDLTGHAAMLEVTLASTGPQGIPGAQGAQGLQGIQGPAGPPGAAGATGPMGKQGLPGAPGAQGLQGPAGAAGAAGATGPMGGQGLPGPQGPQGFQGLQGMQGYTGPAGPAGPAGAAGPPGPALANYVGYFSFSTSYELHDAVGYNGATYISLIPGNLGYAPDLNSGAWAVLAAQGPAGAAGAPGAAGAAGAPGAAGAVGPMGPAGPPMTFAGAWSAAVAYGVGSAVSYAGSSYIALTANTGKEPDKSPANWGLLAQVGAQGPVGAVGATGPMGMQGVPGVPGPVGPAGSAGAQGAQGVPGMQGLVGPPGPAGAAGTVGVTYRGAWEQGATYRANDVVGYGGGSYLAVASSFGAQPDVSPGLWAVLALNGGAGATGPSGAGASVSVGSVATGAPGTQAMVTNSGTASAAVLNFTIPQGAAGTSGSGGGGATGIGFASVYHAVSYNYTYYSLSNSNAAMSDSISDTVLTWVPAGCTATQLQVFSRQGNAITVMLRQGMPGAMADTGMECSVPSGARCTATGNVAVAAGSFVDVSISRSNGTDAGVWMALTCN